MKLTLGQARQAMELAQSAVGRLQVQLESGSTVEWQRAQLEKQLKLQQNAIIYWGNEFRRLGGDVGMQMPVDVLYARSRSAEEIWADNVARVNQKKQEAMQAQQEALDQATFDDLVNRIRNQQAWIIGQCQRLFQNTKDHWDAGSAVHLFGGESTVRPLAIGGGLNVTPLLEEAIRLRKEGKKEAAEFRLREAAFKVYHSAMQLDAYERNIGIGAERTEAAIKVVAALSMLIATGGTALSVGGAMAVAAAGEGGLQGTLLLATAVDGKQQISAEDLKAAALEVAIAAGSAGLGKYAEKVGKLLAPGALQKFLGKPPSAEQIDWVVKRFVNYVSANSGYIAKRLTGLDKDQTWNVWLSLIAPIVGEVPVELTKEQSLNRTWAPQ
ncbi:MAG: hypothetical protein JNL58_20885 [Planctomyces sp.]|nr:hypothetical protein [Planctomyces sp.]